MISVAVGSEITKDSSIIAGGCAHSERRRGNAASRQKVRLRLVKAPKWRAAARARSSSSAVEIGECNEESDPGVVFTFDITVADRLGARCMPSCLLLRERWANLNIGHSVPQRQSISC